MDRVRFSLLAGILVALVSAPAFAQSGAVQAVNALRSGAKVRMVARGGNTIAAVLGAEGSAALGSEASLDLILSQIQSRPGLAQDRNVITYLVEVGQGRVRVQTRDPLLETISAQLPGQPEFVESMTGILYPCKRMTGTCANPVRQWMGSGYFPAQIPGTVPLETQEATLAAILRAPGDVIEIDLDGTSMMPVARVLRALRRTGERFGIPEFMYPEQLEVLPFYTGGAFNEFVRRTGIDEKYDKLDWRASDGSERGEVYDAFRGAYWSGGLRVHTDQGVPGLARFVELAEQHGKTVVFLSGRPGGPDDTVTSLILAGVPESVARDNLLFGQRGFGGDAETKRVMQEEIRERWGEPAAVIDDRAANTAAVADVVPGVIQVSPRVPGFSSEVDDRRVISTFEIRPEALEDPK